MDERRWLPPWWLFAIFSVVSLLAIDVLDSDRRVVVIAATLILAAGVASAVTAVVVYRRG